LWSLCLSHRDLHTFCGGAGCWVLVTLVPLGHVHYLEAGKGGQLLWIFGLIFLQLPDIRFNVDVVKVTP
ncbi:MAG: hypothetical protein AAGI06_15920, partial [Pseudomonadota bacterium]